MHTNKEYQIHLDAFLTSEMVFIKSILNDLEMDSHPEAGEAICRLNIVYEYMKDRLISASLKKDKRLH